MVSCPTMYRILTEVGFSSSRKHNQENWYSWMPINMTDFKIEPIAPFVVLLMIRPAVCGDSILPLKN